MLEKLPFYEFTWSRWRAGALWDLGVRPRTPSILENAALIRRIAIGWCGGEQLICRPKVHRIAVMFKKDEKIFWTHLLVREFIALFGQEGGT